MSSGMNMQEAEKVAENMSYRQAVINCLYARRVPYRKATKIKMKQLLEIAEKRDEKIKHDKQIRADVIDEFVSTFEKEFAPNLDENLITMIEFNKWFENVTKIAEQLKEQKLCSNGKPCKHPKCNKCGTTHFMSECDYGKE